MRRVVFDLRGSVETSRPNRRHCLETGQIPDVGRGDWYHHPDRRVLRKHTAATPTVRRRTLICKTFTMRILLLLSGTVFSFFIACFSTAPRAEAGGVDRDPEGRLVRVEWNDSRVIGSPEPPLPYRVTPAYPKLELKQPIYVRPEPGSDRMLLALHVGSGQGPGQIVAFPDSPNAAETEPFLETDRLIYGFTFHPDYLENGYLFVICNGPADAENKQNRISRFTVERDPPYAVVTDSELVILEWDSNGHNGGDLAFGPDGYLYCPTGDGTSDSDPLKTGQGLDDLLAVLIRIDVDRPGEDKAYSIPPDNPFVDVPGARPEIWAYGFRNPWRMDYDHELDQLWITQNGQDLWEQVYLVGRGENYGWSVYEGSHPFYLERELGPQPHTPPTTEHHHSEARSLTGGIVYHGQDLPELNDTYLYGDYSTGKIWGVRHDGHAVTYHKELADTTLQITGFAQNNAGELLVVDYGGGINRLEKAPPAEEMTPFPRRLSETGLFSSVPRHEMHAGLIPYSVNAQLWSDQAHKARWIAIPDDGKIDYTRDRGWGFPEGTVLVKSFALDFVSDDPSSRRWIETRLLTKQDGEWVGYSYQWDEQQRDAHLVEKTGKDVEFEIADSTEQDGVRLQTWHYPSRAECMVCHSRAAEYVLGLQERQMNRIHDYGEFEMNQIALLDELGLFKDDLPMEVDEAERLADPYDRELDVDHRARSYLHANCSFCHVYAGGGNSAMDLEISAEPGKALIVDAAPVHTKFGIDDARIVAPGQPERSVLLHRLQQRGRGQMPPLATSLVDTQAVELLREWISELTPPPAEPTEDSQSR